MIRLIIIFCFLTCALVHAASIVPVKVTQVKSQNQNVFNLVVIGKGLPVSQATVIVESQTGQLIQKGFTDSNGRFALQLFDDDFLNTFTITAIKQGFSTVSLIGNSGTSLEIELPEIQPDHYTILEGNINGYDTSLAAGRLKAGLVAKAMNLSDLAHLDSSAFMSPLMDTIRIIKDFPIPSNLTFPDHWFNYGVIPIRINKPKYRLPSQVQSINRFVALTGNADAQRVVDAMNAQDFEKIMDNMSFTHIGVTAKVTTQTKMVMDINANMDIKSYKDFKGINVNPLPSDTMHMIASIWEVEPGVFVPTDIKPAKKAGSRLHKLDSLPTRYLDFVATKKADHFRVEWINEAISEIPGSSITADFTLPASGYASPWLIQLNETYDLMVARIQKKYKNTIGGDRIDDQWVIVAPVNAQFQVPLAAYTEIANSIGSVNTFSVDLIKSPLGGYPIVNGDDIEKNHRVLQKVIK